MKTKMIKLPKVPIEVVAKAKSDAELRGISMAEYLTQLITAALGVRKQ